MPINNSRRSSILEKYVSTDCVKVELNQARVTDSVIARRHRVVFICTRTAGCTSQIERHSKISSARSPPLPTRSTRNFPGFNAAIRSDMSVSLLVIARKLSVTGIHMQFAISRGTNFRRCSDLARMMGLGWPSFGPFLPTASPCGSPLNCRTRHRSATFQDGSTASLALTLRSPPHLSAWFPLTDGGLLSSRNTHRTKAQNFV